MNENIPSYRPHARLISVVGNTAALTLMLAVVTFWHNSQVSTLQASYENRISAIQAQIEASQQSGDLSERSAQALQRIFDDIRRERDGTERLNLITVAGGVLAANLFISALIGSIIVFRNRRAVKAAYEQGFIRGASAAEASLRTPAELTALLTTINEEMEENAQEFVKNYVQRGGE